MQPDPPIFRNKSIFLGELLINNVRNSIINNPSSSCSFMVPFGMPVYVKFQNIFPISLSNCKQNYNNKANFDSQAYGQFFNKNYMIESNVTTWYLHDS